MAYIKPLTDEEQQQINAGQPLVTSGGGQIIGTQGGASGAPNMPSPQASGTSGFADISAYLAANKPQTQELAQKFAGQMGEQATAAKGLVGQAGEAFKGQVGAGTVQNNPDLLKSALEKPVEFTQTPENVAKLTAMREAQYTGPENIESTDPYAKARAAVTEAQRVQGLPQTPEGRREMLYGAAKNPTRGMVTLDEALLGQSPEAQETLKQGAAQFGGLSDYLTQQSTEGQKAVEEAKKATQETSGAVKTGLAETEKKIQEDIDKRVAEARAKAGERVTAMTPALQNIGTQALTDEQLADLGITKEQYQNLLYLIQSQAAYASPAGKVTTPESLKLQQDIYNAAKPQNINLADYFSQTQLPEVGITKENVANPEDYAKYLALSGLAGEQPSYLTPTTQEQAGTANLDLSQFDFGAAQTAEESSARNADKNYLQWLYSQAGMSPKVAADAGMPYVYDPNENLSFYPGQFSSTYGGEDVNKLAALGNLALGRYGLSYLSDVGNLGHPSYANIPVPSYVNKRGNIPGQ